MNKPAIIESMTRLRIGPYTVRIWRNEAALLDNYDASNADLRHIAYGLEPEKIDGHRVYRSPYPKPPAIVATFLDKADRINAIEVVDGNGRGVVVYPEWP